MRGGSVVATHLPATERGSVLRCWVRERFKAVEVQELVDRGELARDLDELLRDKPAEERAHWLKLDVKVRSNTLNNLGVDLHPHATDDAVLGFKRVRKLDALCEVGGVATVWVPPAVVFLELEDGLVPL